MILVIQEHTQQNEATIPGAGASGIIKGDMKEKKGKCPICGKGGHDQSLHIIEQSWLYELIKKYRPEWIQEDGACPKCVEFYEKKIK